MKKNISGFSLVELVIVMGIISVLSIVSFVNYKGALKTVKHKASELEMVEVCNALLLYEVDKGHLPNSLDKLHKLFDGDGYKYDSFGELYQYDRPNRKLCSTRANRCRRF